MTYRRFPVSAAAIITVATFTLAACGESGDVGQAGSGGNVDGADSQDSAKLDMDGAEVLQDGSGSGVDVSKRLFESAETVVVAEPNQADQMQAAAVAVSLGAPMLVRHPEAVDEVDEEIARLGADRVIEVPGDTDEEDIQVIADTEPIAPADGESDIDAIAGQAAAQPLPIQLPPVLATGETSRAAVASAISAGADVQVLGIADPRETSESMRLVTEQDTLAIGQQWGSNDDYRARVALASNGELPGGGGLVFPGRRMIALYGHPYGPELGVMGEQPPAEAAKLAQEYASWYEGLDEQPIIPAFEVIVTVASEYPGDDDNYSNETPAEDIVPYVDAILDAGGYAVLDLQPGQGSFLEQVKIYEELLKRPNVGLALDAEWKLNPGEAPLSRIGSASAAEINEVANWLAALVRDNNLPQKALILHQFQTMMYPDRENIVTGQPELAWVLHADGHGVSEQKFDTWNVLREDLDPEFFMAWKNFIDEDTPMFTPEQTYADVNPRPWFVSYQ
ncbi:cell wall-binding repeat-containing protein [Corynebacterium glaucum]|uniref:cell wall-binding repeat-containing protein n=1 Tax=Corynebacterium glaucum TaxID=187491 RepID=UPI0025B613DA|nr:cell wall-binding repeat-containing protein [Corynebacterium glaucum]WJZ07606.1 hypothetical protein CGLAUT_05545 [Corynebacterium glaucum]